MVAGALRNPWVFLGPSVRLDEAFFSRSGGGCEVETIFGGVSGIPPKNPASDPDSDPEAEYLYIEELPEAPEAKMAKVCMDSSTNNLIVSPRIPCFFPAAPWHHPCPAPQDAQEGRRAEGRRREFHVGGHQRKPREFFGACGKRFWCRRQFERCWGAGRRAARRRRREEDAKQEGKEDRKLPCGFREISLTLYPKIISRVPALPRRKGRPAEAPRKRLQKKEPILQPRTRRRSRRLCRATNQRYRILKETPTIPRNIIKKTSFPLRRLRQLCRQQLRPRRLRRMQRR